MREKKAGRLALCGVFSALALLLLYMTTSPVSTVGLAALAAVCGVPVVVEVGRRAALAQFVAVTVLAWLLIPAVEGKVLYTAFFGWYTVFKAWLESRRLPLPAELAVKLAVFILAMAAGGAAIWLLLHPTLPYGPAVLAVAGVVLCGAFLLYDWGLSRLVGVYATRLHPPLSRLLRL